MSEMSLSLIIGDREYLRFLKNVQLRISFGNFSCQPSVAKYISFRFNIAIVCVIVMFSSCFLAEAADAVFSEAANFNH